MPLNKIEINSRALQLFINKHLSSYNLIGKKSDSNILIATTLINIFLLEEEL